MIAAPVVVIHRGRTVHLPTEIFWVWDMGPDLTFCNALLEDENLLPAEAGENDDAMLLPFVTHSGPYGAGEGEELLLAHLQSRSNYALSAIVDVASLSSVAQAGPDLPTELVDDTTHTEALRSFAQSVSRQTSQARVDAWGLDKILEARKLLLQQMTTPDAECRRRLEEIKLRYPEAFGDAVHTPCKLRKFEIELKPGFKYFAFLPRRASEPVIAEMKKQIEALLQQGVIEHCADSPFAFPIVMVRRPNSEKYRLCVDYKLQNDQTIPSPFPVPDIRSQLDRLAGKRFYCSLDCSQFFHQFEISESSRYLTAFVVPWGEKFQYRRCPFGLRNCPAHCQQAFSSLILKSNIRCIQDIQPYLDDVAFGADSVEELCEKFEAICQLAVQNNLKFKESKCVLGATAIAHLGFVVNRDGIHIAPSRVDSLLKLPSAKDVDDIRHILGSFVFCREWLTDMTSMTAPLTDLLKKGAKWEWGPSQERALRLLKESVLKSECLAGTIDPSRKVYARSDSSILGVACVLFQILLVNGILKPRAIAYASRRYTPTEFKWILNEKEAYSIKFIFEKFGDILKGHQVECQTDHRNSLWIQQSKSPKVIRWRMFLNQWDHVITHLPGKENSCADGMSRVQEMQDAELDELIHRLHVTNLFEVAPSEDSVRIGELDDEGTDADVDSAMLNAVLSEAMHELQCRSEAPVAPHVQSYASLSSVNGELFESTDTHSTQEPSWIELEEEGVAAVLNPVAGTNFRLIEQIKKAHSDTVGHVGALRTYRRVRLMSDLPADMTYGEMLTEVTNYVRACPTCQKLSSLPSPWKDAHFRWIRSPPFKEISIDVLEMPHADLDGNLKTFVVIDSFSRALEPFPLSAADAVAVAECLFAVYCRFGRFSVVRCDGAKAFIGSVLPLLMRLLGSQCHQIHAFSHWENGQVERAHKEVLRHLRPLIISDRAGANSHRRWNTLLHGARRILMNTVNCSTGVAPNALVYGGFADREEDLFLESASKSCLATDIPAFISELELEQCELMERAITHQQRDFERIIAKSDSSPDTPLTEGAWVLAKREGMPHGRPHDKFQCPWTGPWRVLERPDPSHPVVECCHAADHRVVHFHRHELKPFDCLLMDNPDEYAHVAQRDFWDYSIDFISSHRPLIPRRAPRRRPRTKDSYDFLVHYKFLPLSTEDGCENPSYQPYNNLKHTSALQEYCNRPEVIAELGADFLTPDN